MVTMQRVMVDEREKFGRLRATESKLESGGFALFRPTNLINDIGTEAKI